MSYLTTIQQTEDKTTAHQKEQYRHNWITLFLTEQHSLNLILQDLILILIQCLNESGEMFIVLK